MRCERAVDFQYLQIRRENPRGSMELIRFRCVPLNSYFLLAKI